MERTLITTLTPDEIRQLIVESVQYGLKNLKPAQDDVPGEASQIYVSKQAAAKSLGCCVASIDNLRRAGKLKTFKVGGKSVRFLKADVLALAETQSRKGGRQY